MKAIYTLLILLIPFVGFGQLTMIPDPNFEQILIDLGYDNVLDGNVNTASIDTVTNLYLYNSEISDLTGVEDFTSLNYLYFSNTPLTNLDVSQNTSLTSLYLYNTQLTSLDVSQNTSLTSLSCDNNQITSLDVSQNTFLEYLSLTNNQITSIDLSNNLLLDYLQIGNNNLTSLDITNLYSLENLFASNNQISSIDLSSQTFFVHLFLDGNNLNQLDLTNLIGNGWNCGVAEWNFQCQDLNCIEVNDLECWNNWMGGIDTTFQQFSINCNSISNISENVFRKKIFKITDLLGKESEKQNRPLIYFYSDGTIEKKVIIE